MNYLDAYVVGEKKSYCPVCKAEHKLYIINAVCCGGSYCTYWFCKDTKKYWSSARYSLEKIKAGYGISPSDIYASAEIPIKQIDDSSDIIQTLDTVELFCIVATAVFLNYKILAFIANALKGLLA